ncbi:MAG: hypothetical protein WA989_12795, partial [Henriciella sp.]
MKPELIAASQVASTHDAGLLRDALNAVESGNWSTVRSLEAQARDETVRQLILWYRGRGDVLMSFDELDNLLNTQGDWPQMRSVQVRAEEAVALSALSSEQRIAWFESIGGPISGSGRLALAEAYRRTNDYESAVEVIRNAWHGNTLDSSETADVLSSYGNSLTQEDHQKRADFLMWTAQRTAASRLKPYLNADWKALIEARIR